MYKNQSPSRCLPDEGAVLLLRRTDRSPGRVRVWRYSTRGASLICSVSLFLGGCVVAKDKYETAVAAVEAAKTELKNSRKQHDILRQENEKLRADHEKAAFDLEMLSAEIQQVKESHESERDLFATHEAEWQSDREVMVSKLREMQRVHQKLKSQNRTLRDTVRRYEKELKDAREARVKSVAPASGPTEKRAPEIPPVVARKPSPKPAPPPVAVPFKGTVTPVNINTASANDLVLFLGLTQEVADKVVSNRPYRLRGELVAKQVVPQPTFDVLRDRITAAPR